MNVGCLQVYTGEGKGKTSAAIGLAARAWGREKKVLVVFLMKEGVTSGEHRALERLDGLEMEVFGGNTLSIEADRAAVQRRIGEGVTYALARLSSGDLDVVVIDELCTALGLGLVDLGRAIELIEARPADVELVITGRSCPEEVLDRADLVTEMKEVKHPFHRGLAARRGIEF